MKFHRGHKHEYPLSCKDEMRSSINGVYFDFLLRATTQSFISWKKTNFASLDMIPDSVNSMSGWLIHKIVFFMT